jgi:hypothetical protein
MPEVRFINLEYFFYKIYDFLGGVFGNGSGNNGFGISSGAHRTFGQWLVDVLSTTASIVWVLIIIAFLVLFCVIIYTRLRMYELDQKHKAAYNAHFIKPEPKVHQLKNPRWEYVEKLFASDNSNDWRVAIIEADTMLDELVQSYNFPGENLGERLKNANPKLMPTLQSAWEAHKVRNRIAHDGVNFQLSEREAQITKKHFEFIFKNAGIL